MRLTRAQLRSTKWTVDDLDGRVSVTAAVRVKGYRIAYRRPVLLLTAPYVRDDELLWYSLRVVMRGLIDRASELEIV